MPAHLVYQDPGYRLVAEAHANGLQVTPIPGASALTSLVSASGLPNSRFEFVGFAVKRIGSSIGINRWQGYAGSIIFYDSTRRLKKSLNTIERFHPSARLAIGREMTKLHEEVKLVSMQEALIWSNSMKV